MSSMMRGPPRGWIAGEAQRVVKTIEPSFSLS